MSTLHVCDWGISWYFQENLCKDVVRRLWKSSQQSSRNDFVWTSARDELTMLPRDKACLWLSTSHGLKLGSNCFVLDILLSPRNGHRPPTRTGTHWAKYTFPSHYHPPTLYMGTNLPFTTRAIFATRVYGRVTEDHNIGTKMSKASRCCRQRSFAIRTHLHVFVDD